MPRKRVEEALAAWRHASRQRDNASDGHREALNDELDRAREAFHDVSANYMMDRIDALQEAEARRKAAVPSTGPFHEAARDEKDIAAEIWDAARSSDEDSPTRTAEDEERRVDGGGSRPPAPERPGSPGQSLPAPAPH